jgi:methyl-accepting chemotaxis protein
MKFPSLRLKTKIAATALIPIFLFLILATVGLLCLNEVVNMINSVDDSYRTVSNIVKVQNTSRELKSAMDSYLLSRRDEFPAQINQLEKESSNAFDLLKREASSPDRKNMLSDAQEAMERWKKEVVEPSVRSRRLVDRNNDWEKFHQIIGDILAKESQTLSERKTALLHFTSLVFKIVIFGALFIVVLALPLGYIVPQSITRPLAKAVDLAKDIAAGNLSRTLESQGDDEVGILSQALNQMVESLRDNLKKTAEGARTLASSASQISSSVSQMAASATETSSSITETVSTVEELLQTARLTSEKARNVAQSAHFAVQTSHEGEKAIEETVNKMSTIRVEMESIGETVQRLNEQSQSIEDIINSVRDLADQSNLLAVNASIEAAKAGEQGKGFAVVAGEIKSLADRSREATEQVRNILEDTRKWIGAVVMATEQGSKAVAAGVKQTKLAGDSIRSLGKSVLESADAATVIQSSNEQQTVGVDQVSNAIAYIDQAMRQNVAGANQLEEAARQISDLGISLKELVERYKT